MDGETLNALEASIAHWQDNVAAETPEQASTRGEQCALCQMFLADCCIGCPVMKHTGEDCCANSPYMAADVAHKSWRRNKTEQHKLAFRAAAQDELEFLQSLLPEEE